MGEPKQKSGCRILRHPLFYLFVLSDPTVACYAGMVADFSVDCIAVIRGKTGRIGLFLRP